MLEKNITKKILPPMIQVCSFCEKILSDSGDCEGFGDYIRKYPYADVSHGICPSCLMENFPEEYLAICDDQKSGKILLSCNN